MGYLNFYQVDGRYRHRIKTISARFVQPLNYQEFLVLIMGWWEGHLSFYRHLLDDDLTSSSHFLVVDCHAYGAICVRSTSIVLKAFMGFVKGVQ